MLLATKCPHCQTSFRVANDQLKLQAGLVRCGVCQQVFNGIEHLAGGNNATSPSQPVSTPNNKLAQTTRETVTNDSTEPKAATTPLTTETTPPAPKSSTPQIESIKTDELDVHALSLAPLKVEERVEPTWGDAPASPSAKFDALMETPVPSGEVDLIRSRTTAEIEAEMQALLDADLQAELLVKNELSALEFAAQQPSFYSESEASPQDKHDDSVLIAKAIGEFDETYNSPRPTLASLLGNDTLDGDDRRSSTNEPDLNDLEQLRFIRQAKTKKRLVWFFTMGTIVLFLLLCGQAIYQFRNLIAVSYPASKEPLVAMCHYAQCQIQLPTQIDAISYEGDELHSLPHENRFEFGLLLHNHSNLTQAWPSIELTLKNGQKQAVLRRVFAPSEYLSNPVDITGGFAANQEQAVKMYFEVKQIKASDYVVAIFYP